MLDNYDSFTYNLVQYIQELVGSDINVYRNDQITLEEVDAYDIIILSPGPGLPQEAGIMSALLQRYASAKKILGVCLGHQAIGEAFGASLKNLDHVYHGVETPMQVIGTDTILFSGVPAVFPAGRYHSWVVEPESLPDELIVTARDSAGEIMAMRHRNTMYSGCSFTRNPL